MLKLNKATFSFSFSFFAFLLSFSLFAQNNDILVVQKPVSETSNKPGTYGVNYKLSGDKSKIIILSDNQLEIWDTNSKRIILKKELEQNKGLTDFEINYTGNIYAIIKTYIKEKENNTIQFYNINENKPFFKLHFKPDSPIEAFTKIKFNKTGEKFSIVYKTKGIDIYRIKNKVVSLLKHLDVNSSALVRIKDFEFSDDDKHFFIFLGDNFSSTKPIIYQKWSLESFNLIQTIESKKFKLNTTMMLELQSRLGFKTTTPGWNLEQGLFVNCKYMQMHSSSKRNGNIDVNINPNHKSFLELYSVKKDKTINLLSHNVGFNEAIISDSETIITSDENRNIQVWDIKTGKLINNLNTNEVIDTERFSIPYLKKLSRISIVVVDSRKKEIYYSFTGQNIIRVWNYKYNTNDIFQSNMAKVEFPFFSSDSTIVYKKDLYLEHFDFKNQNTIQLKKESNTNKPFHFTYSQTTNKGLTKTDNAIKLWDINSLVPTDSIKTPNSSFNTYFTNPDLSYCAVVISESITNAFSSLLKDKNEPLNHEKLMKDLMKNVINKVYKIDGSKVDPQKIKIKLYKTENFILEEITEITIPAFTIQKISFMPKSNRMLISAFNTPIAHQTKDYIPYTNYIYDISKKTLSALPKEIKGIAVMIPSTNNFILLNKNKNNQTEVKVIDVNSNKVLNSFSFPNKDFLGNWKLDFIDNNQIILYGKNTNFLLNLGTKTIKPTNNHFDSFSISQNKKLLVTTRGEISLYSSSLKNKLYEKYFHKDNQSNITILPNNYYLNKGKGHELITLLKHNKAYSFEQFDLKYHRPDLVIEAIKETISNRMYNTKGIYELAYAKRLERMEKKEDELDSNFHTPELTITNKALLPNKTDNSIININLEAYDNKYKLHKLQISINGVLIKNLNIKLIRQNTFLKTLPIVLSNGKNKILISVINNKGTSSAKEEIDIEYVGKTIPSNLFVVSLGVSKYQHLKVSPNSSKDAKTIADLFKIKNKNVKSLSLIDNEVTKNNFNKISDFLSTAQENDNIIFFISGHALRNKSKYYFCASNSKTDNILSTGITYDDIDSLLANTKSRNRLLILNTCYSGEVYDANNLKEIDAINLMRDVFEDLKLTNGTTVISASEGTNKYYESNTKKNGAITLAILNLIEIKKEIKVQEFCKEIINYCTKKNNEDPFKSSLNKNTPLIRFSNIYNNFKIW